VREIDETTELSHSRARITAACDLTINEGSAILERALRLGSHAWAGERIGG